jgi:hypothetical protein
MTLKNHWLTNLLQPPFLFKLKDNDEVFVCDRIEINREGMLFIDDRLGQNFGGDYEIEFVKDIESRRIKHVGKKP